MTLTFLHVNKIIKIKNVIYFYDAKDVYVFKIKNIEKLYYIKKEDTLLIKKTNYTKFDIKTLK